MAELAVVYSSLILHDGGAELSAENMKKLCDAANVSVEGYWFSKFAEFLATENIENLINSISSGPSSLPSSVPSQAAQTVTKETEEESKVEEEKEEDFDVGGLFDDDDDY